MAAAALVDVAMTIVNKVVEYLVKPAILEVKCFLCIDNIIQDLRDVKEELTSEKDSLQDRVEQAKGRTEVIEKPVGDWLNVVESLLKQVADMEKTMTANNNNACFQGRCPTWRRYRLCKKMLKKIEAMEKFKGKSNIEPFSHRAPLLGIQYESSGNFTCFESTKVAYDQLLEALKDDHIFKIGVYGMGGCGKTTLVTQVGKKAKELKLFDEVISVTVSQTPDIRCIQGKMADMLGLKLEEESDEGRAQRLWMCLKQKKRVLIIVDDVWGEFNLKDIGICLGEDCKGIVKIIITTRRFEVCESMDCQKRIRLGLLMEDESWTLFQSRANIDDHFSKSLDDVPRKLCDECNGLPIAIVSVASSLKGKSQAEWRAALDCLKNSEAIDDHVEEGVRDAFKALKLSYDYLKNKEVELLLLMCSLFPEDHEIILEDLIRYAVGLGLGGRLSLESARNRIEAGINKLIGSCLLMPGEKREKYVKMHDLVRDVALWITKTSNDRKILVNFKRPLSTLVDDENTMNVFGLASWYNENQISLQWDAPNLEILLLNNNDFRKDSMDLSESTFKGINGLKVLSTINTSSLKVPFSLPQSTRLLANLRTLRLEGWDLGDISFVAHLTTLEVLDLKNCSFNGLPNETGKELKRLKLLSLIGCRIEQEYNGAIGKCAELEELYFTKCHSHQYFVQSVGDIVNLPNLKRFVMHNRGSRFLIRNEDVIQRGRRILAVKDVHISKIGALKRNNILQTAEFVSLKELHGGCRNMIPDMIGVEGGMKDLTCLHLKSCKEIECIIDTASVPRSQQDQIVAALIPKLVNLELSNLVSLTELFRGTPQQVQHFFEKLERLVIYYCPKLQSIFPPELLCNLGNLKILTIDRASLKALFTISVAQSLACLEELTISFCDELKHVVASHGCNSTTDTTTSRNKEIISTHHCMMPSLKTLVIRGCRKLKYIFPICSVVEGFAQLQEILLDGVPELEYVFGECGDHHSSQQVLLLLPQLESLSVFYLKSIIGLCPEKYNVKWTSHLRLLRVWRCPKLTTSWIAMMISSDHMDQRFALSKDHLPSSSRLQRIELEDLPQLNLIGPTPTQILSLDYLQYLQVQGCENLKSLFSIAVHKSLPELMTLQIFSCQQLEQIIEGNDDEIENISNAQVLFPKLTHVTVKSCNKLESLFSAAILRMLPRLSTLHMSRCDQLEVAFKHGSEDDTTITSNGTEIMLPNLTEIHLDNLPNFVDICYGFKLQAVKLQKLKIYGCPNIAPSLREIEEQLSGSNIKAG